MKNFCSLTQPWVLISHIKLLITKINYCLLVTNTISKLNMLAKTTLTGNCYHSTNIMNRL